MISCNGVCKLKYKAITQSRKHGLIFLKFEACRPCDVFYPKGKYKRCPCCNCNLSILPRHSNAKKKYLELKN